MRKLVLSSRFFLTWEILNKFHIFIQFFGSKNGGKIAHILRAFLEHFLNKKILRCLQLAPGYWQEPTGNGSSPLFPILIVGMLLQLVYRLIMIPLSNTPTMHHHLLLLHLKVCLRRIWGRIWLFTFLSFQYNLKIKTFKEPSQKPK